MIFFDDYFHRCLSMTTSIWRELLERQWARAWKKILSQTLLLFWNGFSLVQQWRVKDQFHLRIFSTSLTWQSLRFVKPFSDFDYIYILSHARAVRDRLQLISCGDGGKFPKMDLKDILIDLSCYESDDLVCLSLNLLTVIYFHENDIFSQAAHCQLLIAQQSITTFKEVQHILPKLRQLLSVDCDVDDQGEIVKLLKELTHYCTLPGGKEPNKENQLLLYNHGIK